MLLCAAALASCDKVNVQSITEAPPGGTRIKFANFGLNAPSVNFFADGTKMTAVTSGTGVEATTGTAYGSFGAGGYYTDIVPGQHTLAGKITATTDNGVAIANLPATLEAGKFYTFYLSGFYNTTAKTSDAFIVEDPFPANFDYAQAYVRFVNASPNASPMTLFAKNTTTAAEVALGGAVAYKAAGTFTALPAATYDLSTRVAGSSTNAISRTGVSFVAGNVYTISARGDMTVTSTSATNRPFLDNTANR